MNELIVFLLVILVLTAISAGFHYWIHKRIWAILIPTIVVPFITPLIDYFVYDEIDPFTLDAVINAFIMMLIISYLVSIPFHSFRTRKRQD
ncbi:hypothetical protein [Aliiglaciecola litoralis]|uniref:Uncharacterized protein n=1 Tax=Aliiglaciecola litoralis TaxID=582857 RepID=A0ABP3WM98_9ALTE